MTTPYYTPSGNPINFSRGQAQTMRAEFALIQTAFNNVQTDSTGFTAAGTGAILRSPQEKARDIVSVKDFGAVADSGITDNSAKFQAADAAVDGGLVFVPPALTSSAFYKVIAAITLTASLVGGGYLSHIRTAHATNDVLTTSTNYTNISNLRITSSVVRSGGSFVSFLGAGLSRCSLSGFWMTGPFIGVRSTAAGSITIEDGQIFECIAATGVGVSIENGVDNSVRNVLVDAAAQILAGVRISKCGDTDVIDCQLIHGGSALLVNPTAGNEVDSVWVSNTFLDNSTRAALLDAQGGIINRCIFDECWLGSSTFQGALLRTSAGGTINGVEFNACHGFLNGSDAISLADTGVTNVTVQGGAYAQNVGAGLNAGVGVGDWAVLGARMGATHGFLGNAYGIFAAAGAGNNIRILGNDLRGNTTSNLTYGATGTVKAIRDNLGVSDAWSVYTPTVAATAGLFNTLGTLVGKYKLLDQKSMLLNLVLPITLNGTAATAVTATMPTGYTAANISVLPGRENAVTGSMLQAVSAAASGTLSITKYDNTYPGGDGRTLVVTGALELA